MPIHKNDVLEFLERNPIRGYNGNIGSLLELLCHVYTECNVIDTEEFNQHFQELDELLKLLPWGDLEKIYTVAIGLCVKHEIRGFSNGILVGMHLMTEINSLP